MSCQQLNQRAPTERADGLSYGSNAVPLIRHTPSATQLFASSTVYESILFRKFELGRYILRLNLKVRPGNSRVCSIIYYRTDKAREMCEVGTGTGFTID